MICRVCDEFNCTPTEAINELRTNPMIMRLLETRSYARTYEAVDRWTSMNDKQRAHATAPSGAAANLVHKHTKLLLDEEKTERHAALDAEGRV